MQKNEDDFPHRRATNVKTQNNLTKWHAAFTFESASVHVRSLHIYEYFMVAIISTIFIMIQYVLSYKMICAVLDV